MTRRMRFFSLHLICSLIIIAAVGVVMWMVWYPIPYRAAGGGVALLSILAVVDVILGPSMTLFLSKPLKGLREITLDLCLVALVQLAALAYGVHSIFSARPVHTVFEVDRFTGISANDVIAEDLPSAAPEFQRLPFAGPTVIGAHTAKARTQTELMNSVNLALAGFDISSQPKRWVPYASVVPEVLKASKPAERLISTYPAMKPTLEALAKGENASLDQLRFLPMVIHKAQWTAVLSPDASRIVGYFHVDGFVDEKQPAPASGGTPAPATKAEKAPAKPQ